MASIESLLDYSVSETPSILEVRTDTVVPISSDIPNRKYIFRLEPIGVLDSNTLLQFKLSKSASADGKDTELRVNCFNGILGSVKNVIFRVGDFELNNTNMVNKWSTLTNMVKRRRVDLNKYDSFYLGNQFHSKIDETEGEDYGQYIVDDVLSGYDFSTRTANSLHVQVGEDVCWKYGIPLGKLVPALMGKEIPLFLFDQYRINLEIEFHPPSVYMNARRSFQGTAVATDKAVNITQVQLLVDYLIYPSSILEKDRASTLAEGGLVLDFYNVVNVQRQLVVPAAVDPGSGTAGLVDSNALYLANGAIQPAVTSLEYRIGQENREVHQIFMTKTLQGKVVDADGAVPDNRASLMLEQRIDGISQESIQWRINGVDVYPEPKSATSSQYDQMYYALGYSDLQVERPMFYCDANSISAGTTAWDSGLQGTYKPIGYDAKVSSAIIGGGTMCGQYPIVLRYECQPAWTLDSIGSGDTGNKTCTAQNGTYDVDFFITTSRRAIIKSSPKGMVVSVSF